MAFKLPKLPYKSDALKKFIGKRTMEIHYGKHHNGYTNKLNAAIKGTKLEKKKIEAILAVAGKSGAGVRNNGGGYYNHSLFWKVMSPTGGKAPTAKSKLGAAIEKDFGSFEKFQEEFATAAKTQFGSGWAWLCVDKKGKLFVSSTPNQDNPLMDCVRKKGTPILGLDVWEHAYYLKYQNRRPDYVTNFFKVINWKEVTKRFTAATK